MLLGQGIDAIVEAGELELPNEFVIPVERTRDLSHGDFASPVAMALARTARRKPRELAEQIISHLPTSPQVEDVEIAGPGFINFRMTRAAFQGIVNAINREAESYGRSKLGEGRRVQVEFVSTNPTGPLHVGHGRGAAYGAAVSDLLGAAGFDVQREYYVNDAGRQMDILATSVWVRYLELCGEVVAFPEAGYRGDYIHEIALSLHGRDGDAYHNPASEVQATLSVEAGDADNKERDMDALIARAKTLLGDEGYRAVFDHALNTLVADIRDDLEDFGVLFDRWYSERSLWDDGLVDQVLEQLRKQGHIYERDGASWFRSSDFGDEKDRVLIKQNGEATYLLPDIAYHAGKLDRGFERLIDVWGADHHGHIGRMKAALQALGKDPDCLDVLLVQFANLYRGGKKVQMSTRSGEFVTLRELREEVGNDAARFFYVTRRSDQHLDFDLDLAKAQSSDNPVYYIQYAHARICSVIRQLKEKGYAWDGTGESNHLDLLDEHHELELLRCLSRYPEVVESAALSSEPHQLAFYLRELANSFHAYYNAHTFLVSEANLREARLCLIAATRRVIHNGLALLGVSSPEAM